MLNPLHEGEAIQRDLKESHKGQDTNKISKELADLKRKGNVNLAIKFVQTKNKKNGTLPFNDETIKLLKQKHLRSADASEDILLLDDTENIHFIKNECKAVV